MKRFILFLAATFMFAVSSVDAQIISYSQTKITKVKKPRVGFLQQSAEVVIGGPADDIDWSAGANYIVGYRFNNCVFLGGGLGVSYEEITTSYYGFSVEPSEFQARLFLNAKFYLNKRRVQPYFDLSVGGVYWESYYSEYVNPIGLLINPQFGVNYKLNDKLSLYANIGYQVNVSLENSYPVLKLGVTF